MDVMDEPLVITRRFAVPAAELTERFSRSSGPGGQGVNTADSRVELTFDVAGSPAVPADLRERLLVRLAGRLVDGRLTVAVSDERRQLANRRLARQRLAQLLREAAAPPPVPAARPSPPVVRCNAGSRASGTARR